MPWARKKSVVHGIFYLLLQICILEREEEVTMRGKRKILWGTMTLLLVLALSTMTVFAADGAEEYVPDMYATFWSLIPPVVAIVLALITKEVYSSLFIGILIGGVFYSGFQFERTITHVFQDGIVGVLSDSYNVGILVFLVILGDHGMYDEQSGRLCGVRALGQRTYQEPYRGDSLLRSFWEF